MLEWRPSRVGGVRDRDYIPMSPKMLAENGVVGFADFPALEGWRGEVTVDHRMKSTGHAYDELEILGKSEPQNGQHTFKLVF